MLSGDIKLNPGPQLENLIEYSSYLKNSGSSHLPLFFLINSQNLKNKFEEFLNIFPTVTNQALKRLMRVFLNPLGLK